MPLTIIKPRRLYQHVADQLRALIDTGEYAVGDRLPTERELAVRLGVSRPTVREALIALEVNGRVRIRVGSGIYVLAPPSRLEAPVAPIAGPFDLLRARALIEGEVAARAAERISKSDIATLDHILDDMDDAAHPGPTTLSLDRAFHIAVADILGNDAITKIVGDLFDQRINPYFEGLARHFENAASWQSALGEHRSVRNALAKGDAATARTAMQSHMQNAQERFSRAFGDGVPSVPVEPLVQAQAAVVTKRRKSQ